MQQTNNFIVLNVREYLENDDGRLGFYESYGFKKFDTWQTISKESEPHELIQLLRLV